MQRFWQLLTQTVSLLEEIAGCGSDRTLGFDCGGDRQFSANRERQAPPLLSFELSHLIYGVGFGVWGRGDSERSDASQSKARLKVIEHNFINVAFGRDVNKICA